MNLRITLFLASVFALSNVFAQVDDLTEHPNSQTSGGQNAGDNGVYRVNYYPPTTGGLPYKYTDELENANYQDNGTGGAPSYTPWRILPAGVGTRVRLEFTNIGIGAGDSLIGYNDGACPTPPCDIAPRRFNFNPGNQAAASFNATVADRGFTSYWYENNGGDAGTGWSARMILIDDDGDQIPTTYPWSGVVAGNSNAAPGGFFASFVDGGITKYVYCGTDVNLDYNLIDNGADGFSGDQDSYVQRLDSVIVNWNDPGNPGAAGISRFPNPNIAAHRNGYDATGEARFTTPAPFSYAAPGAYSADVRGVDEIGVFSQNDEVEIIVMGDQPNMFNTPDTIEICDDESTSIFGDIAWSYGGYELELETIEWQGPDPSDPIGTPFEFKSDKEELRIGSDEYPTEGDPGYDADYDRTRESNSLGDGYVDYRFTYTVTFRAPGANGSNDACFAGVPFTEDVILRVYKQPNAGLRKSNPEYSRLNKWCPECTEFDLENLLAGFDPAEDRNDPSAQTPPFSYDVNGTWTDFNGDVVNNGIATNRPGPGSYGFRYEVENKGCGSDVSTVIVQVIPAPNSGTTIPGNGDAPNTAVEICEDTPDFDLRALLNGEDSNGKWFYRLDDNNKEQLIVNDEIVNQQFLDVVSFAKDPAKTNQFLEPEQSSRLYQFCYTVASQFPGGADNVDECADKTINACDSVETCVYVRVYSKPFINPVSVDTSVCQGEPVISLDNFVEDEFRISDGWVADPGNPQAPQFGNASFFDPSFHTQAGVYTFTKQVRNPNSSGVDICDPVEITVNIEFHVVPEAGQNNTVDICPNMTYNLFTFLAPDAELVGTFYRGTNPPMGEVTNPMNYDFESDEGTQVIFTYETRSPTKPDCNPDRATIRVNVNPFPSVGRDTVAGVCITDAAFELKTILGGTAENGGTWQPRIAGMTGIGGTTMFDPMAAGAGTYNTSYVIAANGSCPERQADLTLTVYNEPLAGDDMEDQLCNVDNMMGENIIQLSDYVSGDANGAIYGTAGNFADVEEEFGALEPAADALVNAATGEVNVFTLGGATYNFFYRTHNPGCVSDTAFFEILINQVGFAGRDSFEIVCATEPEFDMRPYLGGTITLGGNPGNPGTTFWDDISEVNDPLGDTDPIDGSDVTYDPATFLGTEEFSPDTGYHYRHYVEVEFCPTDSALVVVYASDTASAGLRKTGSDSLVYFCESEAGEVTLTDGLIDDSFTAPKSDANGTTARWTLVPSATGSLIPAGVLNEVNNANRGDYFTGADSSSFDVKAFIEFWEGEETPAGSRSYTGGFDNLTFWKWLQTDRILNFEYRAKTTMGNLRLPDEYNGVAPLPANPQTCPDDVERVLVAVMPDYGERFTLEVDENQPTALTICKSITDFNLNQFFSELDGPTSTNPRLFIYDIFNPEYDSLRWEGISQTAQDAGAIYRDGNSFFVNANTLNPSKEDPTFDDVDPYALELVLISGKNVPSLDKCGEARTPTPLALDIEKVPDVGGVAGVTNVTLCEGSELVKFYDLITGIKDPFIVGEHFFRGLNQPAEDLRLGEFFGAPSAEPGNYVYTYNNPTEACVSPVVTSYNDPARTTRPRVFKSTIDITVEAGPDLDGYDEAVNEFDVCSDPGVNLSELFPATNNIDNSGSFRIISGCGSIEDDNDFELAVYNWDPSPSGGQCPTVLIRYTVSKPGCPDATLDILLNINVRPFPGTSDSFTMCVNDDNINILTDVLNQEGDPATPGGRFRIMTPGTPAGAVTATGTFNPAIAGVGTHVVRYRVGDGILCEMDSAFATIEVQRILRTGTNGTINACAGQPNIDLFDGLNGFFDRGGLWIPPDDPDVRAAVTGADSSIFRHNFYRQLANPFQTQLVFRYVIDGLCSTDTSQVIVFLTPGATNGDTTVNICNQSQEYNLKDALGNPFQMGGVWRALNGAPIEVSGNDAFIFPDDMNNGTFRYRYEVEAECGDTVLIGRTNVTVNIGDNIDLGDNDTVAICYSGIVNLDVVFGKDGEGVWSAGPSVGPALIDGNKFDSSLVTTQLDAYDFFYSVPKTFEGCSDTVATFTLDIRETPFAGSDTVAFYCDNEGDFPVLNLFPDRRETSTDLETFDVSAQIAANNALSGGNFFPNRLPEGLHTITYTREDSECGSDVAVASIYVEDFGGEGDRCGDLDGDGVINKLDLDVDGDGIANIDEGVTVGGITYDPFGNHDNDALYNYQDPDFAVLIGSAFDGVVAAMDADGDGEPNARDLDSDNDLIPDIVEAFGRQTAANVDGNRDAKTDAVNNDGINNVTASESIRNFDATTAADFLNEDTDGDGIGDIMEGRDHANYSDVTSFVFAPYNAPNGTGPGEPDYRNVDADGDGIEDRFENAGGSLTVVINSNATAAAGIENTDNVPNFRDLDADGDGITDAREAYLETGEPGDRDGDGIPNFLDLDSDNDGIADARELGPTEIPRNTDGTVDALYNNDTDTIPDFLDFDSDGDGILDEFEKGDIQFGEDGINTNDPSITTYVTHSVMITNDAPDYIDLDSDGDRIPDSFEKGTSTGALDTDGDGLFDFADVDSDNDRYLDIYEANGDTLFAVNEVITDFIDFDLDGLPDYLDFDSDDDGINDFYEVVNNMAFINNRPFDTDQDGIPDFHDEDSDNDRLLDADERGEGTEGTNSAPRDSDEDGIFDYRSLDSDSDGLIDRLELDGDCDGDGIPNYRDAGDNCKVEPFVPEAFTPNGDGQNDFFVIPDAPFFPGSTLQVFNRWGGEVFTMKNYDNTWDGTKEGTALPDGTYFYTFDMGIDQEPITGFVYISRN